MRKVKRQVQKTPKSIETEDIKVHYQFEDGSVSGE